MTDTTFTVLDNGYCRVDWLEAEAALTVLSPDSAMAWTGHIGREVLEAVRNKFSQEPEEALTNQELLRKTKKAFVDDREKYTIVIDSDNKKLQWKKSGKVKVKMADIQLEKSEADYQEVQKSFMDFLIRENRNFKSTNDDLQRRQDNLVRDLRQSQKTLEIFEKEKTDLEDNLMSNFLPILNAKKDEIERLRNLKRSSNDDKNVNYDDEDTDVDDEDEVSRNGSKCQRL